MDLAELIAKLIHIGNLFITWHGIETNVESVEEVKQVNGELKVELKLKEK